MFQADIVNTNFLFQYKFLSKQTPELAGPVVPLSFGVHCVSSPPVQCPAGLASISVGTRLIPPASETGISQYT